MQSTAPNAEDDPRVRTEVLDDDDYTSSSGSSSEESDVEESDDGEMRVDTKPAPASTASADGSSIPNVPGRPKPQIHRMEGGSDLMARLSAFLPKMKEANEDLEKEIAAGRGSDLLLDAVEGDGKDYIEMNLGLGVLKEKRADGEDSSSSEESDDEDIADEDCEEANKSKATGDSNVMDKLMGGKKPDTEKPSIEEMAE
ncbi:hypothetical protein N7532_011620 [Penicillium argentinense]|uniref:Uncharacterized protein n=1 Tax=Penicillium argentinense TaxID=1131581 RepID=A0A9W9JVE9_9EURO|nr:uncharacterized protein N7532_011620 [Penicillium argentinense]KAJ5082577.1 hypothetical protein N7532_011620 [Penicillium argentinense]